MSSMYKTWGLVEPNHIKMNQRTLDDIIKIINNQTEPLGIGVDGSSTCTGIAIMAQPRVLIGTGTFVRQEVNRKREDFVEYKVRLKVELRKLLLSTLGKIKYIWYEEPFIGYSEATEVLMAIRTTIKEIMIEHKDQLAGIKYEEVNNKRWKRIFLGMHGRKLPIGSEAEKAAIADVLKGLLVYDNRYDTRCCVVQDEMDACGIVSAGWESVRTNTCLESKKAVHKFKFNIHFEVYDDTPQDVEQYICTTLNDAIEDYKIPRKVVDNGVIISILNGRKLFDNIVYETMQDNDELLILIYNATKYANILFQYGADQGIAEQLHDFGNNQTIVAYVWRKTRK